MSIIVAAAASKLDEVNSVSDLGSALVPLYGGFAEVLIGIGLFAAGLSSAMTAPIAAGYVVAECFEMDVNTATKIRKSAALLVLAIGVFFAAYGTKPIQVIKLAQIANGLLLPVVSTYILWLLMQKQFKEMITHYKWQRFGLFLLTLFFSLMALKSLGLLN